MKVGKIPYLDCEPFYFGMARRGIETRELTPRQLAIAAAAGEVDAGPMPLAACFQLEDQFQPVGGFCVAAAERAESILLCSKRPMAELKDACIGVTDEASNSFSLLQILLTLRLQVKPAAYVGLQEPCDAFLLIGNRALRQRRGERGFPYKYDLGVEWRQWTGLPLVYARWVARKSLDPMNVAELEDALYVGMEDGIDALCHRYEPRGDLRMLPREIFEYIDGRKYFIGTAEQKAIDRFRSYLAALDPPPLKQPQ